MSKEHVYIYGCGLFLLGTGISVALENIAALPITLGIGAIIYAFIKGIEKWS